MTPPAVDLTVTRSLPPELERLLFLHNCDLDPEHWGVCVKLWLMGPFYPLNTSTLQRALNLDRQLKRLWRILDELASPQRQIIRLRYPRKSCYFAVDFPSLPSALRADAQGPPSALTADAHHPPSERMLPPTIPPESVSSATIRPQGVGGGGGMYIPSTTNPTPQDVELEIAGEAGECCREIFPRFYPALLIPHLREARVFEAAAPGKCLRSAIFYRFDQVRRGKGGRDLLALLMRDVQKRHEAPPPSILNRPAVPPPPPLPPPDDRPLTRAELISAAETHARVVTNSSSLLRDLDRAFRSQPAWDDAREVVEGMVERGLIKLKGGRNG